MKKSQKIKLSFFVAENIIFIIVFFCCVAVLCSTYFMSCLITQNITMAIATSVLASVLIPLGLNIGKYVHEKRMLNTICKSVINNSIFLVGRLNNHIASTGSKPFACYSDLKKRQNINFDGFGTFDELFQLMPENLNQVIAMNYIRKQDSFELVVKRLNESIPTAIKSKNYAQLYNNLTLVIGVIGHIKSPIFTSDYIKRFNVGLNKSCKEIESIYFRHTDNYIVHCLENDLSEKENEV